MEIPWGWGGPQMTLWMGNSKGWGVKIKEPSVVGVWIFSGTTHSELKSLARNTIPCLGQVLTLFRTGSDPV